MTYERREDGSASIDVFDAANFFLRADALQGDPDVSPLKLQKLLYLAQGHYLAATGQRLFDEPIMAYEHGPVVVRVWRRYAGLRTPIVGTDADFTESVPIPADVADFLQRVWDQYKDYSASALRNLTHRQQPWSATYVPGELNAAMTDDVMRHYFRSLPAQESVMPVLAGPDGSVDLDVDRMTSLARRALRLHDDGQPRTYRRRTVA
jgi:uncharacterized phage-associated protein